MQYTPPDSILLYQDEKGPVAAKTHGGGPSWCSTQTKIEEKAQKVKGILNTFVGVYDHTNDQMYTHCYTETRPVTSL